MEPAMEMTALKLIRNRKPCHWIACYTASFLLLPFSIYGLTNHDVTVTDTNTHSEAVARHSFTISNVTFQIEDARGREDVFREIAAAVFGLKSGDSVTDSTISLRRASLENCGRFENITLNVTSSTQGTQIRIRLKPFYYVKDLKLYGIWPLFTNEIINSMTLHVGSPYSSILLNEQVKLVHELYRREGISLDSVSITADRDEKDGHYIVHLRVQPGKWYHVETITIEGSRSIPHFKWRYGLGGLREFFPLKGRRFVRKNYENVLKSFLKRYRELHFYDAQLRDSVIMDSSLYTVTLNVQIEEGRRYRIRFEGNDRFSDRILRKECRFESGNRNNMGIRKSGKQLIDFYRQNGFYAVSVEHTLKDTADVKMVSFKIREGLRTMVRDLRITGNCIVKKKEIERQILLRKGKPFSRHILINDVKGIHSLYQQKGFFKTRVDTIIHYSEPGNDQIPVAVEYRIVEGSERLITSVTLECDPVLPGDDLLQQVSVKTGAPFVIGNVYRDRERLSAYIAEKGYPYCHVAVTLEFNKDSSGVDLIYTVDPDVKVYMGRVYPIGNFKTSPTVIKREILMDLGESFSLRKTLESQRNVQNLPIFNSVQLKPVGIFDKRDSIHIFLELEEKEPLYLKLRTGYESEIGIFGETRIGDRNLFGLNKHGWLSGRVYHSSGRIWKVRDAGWQTEAALLEPRLLGTRITASSKVSYERINEEGLDFHADVTTASMAFMRKFIRFVSAGTSLEYELRKASGVRADKGFTSDDLREQFAYRNNLIIRPVLRFDNRDSFIHPRKGFYLGYTMEFSRGINNDIDDFDRNEFVIKGFFSPHPLLTLGGTAKWQSINDTTLSEDQRLFLGGTQDVRGYVENGLAPHGGNVAAYVSLEARIGLPLKLELVLFTDAGQVATTKDPFNAGVFPPDGFKTTTGTGIRYITPVGPVGLLYGHRLNPVHYGAWHFSLGYSF